MHVIFYIHYNFQAENYLGIVVCETENAQVHLYMHNKEAAEQVSKIQQPYMENKCLGDRAYKIWSSTQFSVSYKLDHDPFSQIPVNAKSQTLTTPIQDLQEIFFHIKVSNSKSQTTPIQDSNHERNGPSERTCRGTRRRREEWQGRGDSTATATGDEPRGAPRGGRSRKAGRAAGREEPCRVAATTDGGGGPRSPRPRERRSGGGVADLRSCGGVPRRTAVRPFGPSSYCGRPAPNRTSKSGADRILEQVDPPPLHV